MGAPGNSGLKGQWGVGNPSGPQSSQNPAPQDTGSDEQARQFQAAFQSIQAEINGHLQYTSTNAEASKNATFTSRRDALYSAFQAALGKIDRNDPSKAQGDIDRVLGDARALSGEVGAFRQETEQAKGEWDSRQASFEEAVQQVEELETWEDPQAAGLRGQADEIRTHANERRWREACTALDGLLPAVQPVYAEYLKQKTAQEAFEPALEALQTRLLAVAVSDPAYATLAPMQEDLAAAQTQMEASVQAKDYVQAQVQLQDLATKVDTLEQARAESDAKKQEYEAGLAALQPRLQALSVSDPKYAEIEPKLQEIMTAQAAMEASAQAGDYVQAAQQLQDLGTRVDAYEQAMKEVDDKPQREYEEARQGAQEQLDDCLVMAHSYPALDSDRAALETTRKQMEAAAAAGDYDKAKELAEELETKADAYSQKGAEEQKKFDEKGAEIAKALDDANYFSRDDVARDYANSLSDEQIKFLPTEVRNRLMEEMEGGNFSDDDKAAIEKLYSVRCLDPEFEKAEKKHRDQLIETLRNDPEIAKARADWPALSTEDRVKMMEKVAKYHCDAYGTDSSTLKIETYDKEPKTDADGNVTGWNNGAYNHSSGTLKINTNAYWDAATNEGVKINDFDRALDLATHEAGHRYQHVLAERVESGDLKPGDPEYNQAVTFKLNDKHYVKSSNDAYETQPMETHSRVSGRAIDDADIGK